MPMPSHIYKVLGKAPCLRRKKENNMAEYLLTALAALLAAAIVTIRVVEICKNRRRTRRINEHIAQIMAWDRIGGGS